MRSLRLIAPFRCPFDENVSNAKRNPAGLRQFIANLKREVSSRNDPLFEALSPAIEIDIFQSRGAEDNASQFVSLDQLSTAYQSPRRFSISWKQNALDDASAAIERAAEEADGLTDMPLSKHLLGVADSLNITIYDNTIAILTLDVKMGSKFPQAGWDKLDEWTTHYIYSLLKELYPSVIRPTIQVINEYAAEQSVQYLTQPHDFVLYHDMAHKRDANISARLMWVNRTFIARRGTIDCEWAQRNMNASTAIEVNHAFAHLSIGNNVVETTHDDGNHNLEPLWQGMLLAQYYYAVLDVMSKNILRFVSTTYDNYNNRELRQLSNTMDIAINAATFFLLGYKDLYLELQGIPRKVFQRLEKEWDFDVLYTNVLGKNELCKINVSRLNQCINQRNDLRIQMVLSVVAGLGIVSVLQDMSSYGRTLAQEAYKDQTVGLMDIAQHLTPNMILWVGLLLAVCVSAFVALNRPR